MTALAPSPITEAAIEAEAALLAAAMYDAGACDEALERVSPRHFAEPLYARIWSAVQAGVRRGVAPDPVLVAKALGDDPALAELGGISWLLGLVERASTWAVPSYVEIVLDNAMRRELVALAREVSERAGKNHQEPAEAIIADLERRSSEIAGEGSSRPAAVPASLGALEMIEAAIRGEFAGTPTGFACLDRVTGGIQQSDVWFIGGRTSMGKSVMGLNLVRGISAQGRGCMVFSLEMPLREVQARLISDIAYDAERRYDRDFENFRYGDVLKGRGTADQQARMRAANHRFAALPIAVNDDGGLTIDDIRSLAQRQMRAWDKAGIKRGAVLIDHIGLVRPTHRRGDSKAAETADVVNELKAISKQIKAPVIALCQVNRNTESRSDKRPTMGDLNWSGAIEQIADFVCLLYREAYYLERSSDRDDQARAGVVEHDIEFLIQKNRSGPSCTLHGFVDIACNVIRDKPEEMR